MFAGGVQCSIFMLHDSLKVIGQNRSYSLTLLNPFWPCVESQSITYITCLFLFTNCYQILLLNRICIHVMCSPKWMYYECHDMLLQMLKNTGWCLMREYPSVKSQIVSIYHSIAKANCLCKNSLMWVVSILKYIKWSWVYDLNDI